MSPKDETCAVNIPAFLSKLWKIVNDPEIDNIVSWSSDGRSFVIQDQAQFWYNILPVYYKHNNMSSFVRQLNMYGFHKIHADGKDRDHDELKFYHPFFRKNQPSLMKNIKRKITTTHRTPIVKTEMADATQSQTETQVTNLNHMTKVLVDVKQLQTRQESVDNQLASMKKENAALWRELALLRQKHMKQQQLVNKLIHFLVHIVNPSRGNMGGRKRKFPLMINDIAASCSSKAQKTTDSSSSDDGIIIHEVENEYILPTDEREQEENEEEEEEEEAREVEAALINSPENIMMDSTDEFLDIPMTDEVVDSPDSLCPDNILAEDPDTEILNPHVIEAPEDKTNAEEAEEEEEEEPPLLTPSTIDINELIPPSTISTPSLSTMEAMYPNMSSVQDVNEQQQQQELEDKSKKKLKSDKNDFENHLEATQEELESIKELLLDGYALDPNTMLNLNSNIFTDMPLQLFMSDDDLPSTTTTTTTTRNDNLIIPQPPSTSTSTNNSNVSCDPMVSSSSACRNELMPYNIVANTSNLLDFENLFENENTMDPTMELMDLVNMADNQSTLNTPIQLKMEPPIFPSSTSTTSSTSSTSSTTSKTTSQLLNNNKK